MGSDISLDVAKFEPFTLGSGGNVIATIDYGVERAGYPVFEVSSLSGPVQIEVKYTEPWDALV